MKRKMTVKLFECLTQYFAAGTQVLTDHSRQGLTKRGYCTWPSPSSSLNEFSEVIDAVLEPERKNTHL